MADLRKHFVWAGRQVDRQKGKERREGKEEGGVAEGEVDVLR